MCEVVREAVPHSVGRQAIVFMCRLSCSFTCRGWTHASSTRFKRRQMHPSTSLCTTRERAAACRVRAVATLRTVAAVTPSSYLTSSTPTYSVSLRCVKYSRRQNQPSNLSTIVTNHPAKWEPFVVACDTTTLGWASPFLLVKLFNSCGRFC